MGVVIFPDTVQIELGKPVCVSMECTQDLGVSKSVCMHVCKRECTCASESAHVLTIARIQHKFLTLITLINLNKFFYILKANK